MGKREGRRVTAVRCAADPDSYIVATRIGCFSESAIARTDGLRRTCSESSESICRSQRAVAHLNSPWSECQRHVGAD